MIQHVNAIFEHGVLRPLTPINFQDQEMVALSIEKIGADGSGGNQTGRTLLEILDCAGRPRPSISRTRRWSRCRLKRSEQTDRAAIRRDGRYLRFSTGPVWKLM